MQPRHEGLIVSESTETDSESCSEFAPSFLGEDRHELVAKLAYEHWEARGRPPGSPEVDWFAAEEALYNWLSDRGMISESAGEGSFLQSVLYE